MFEPTLKPATSDYCRYGLLWSIFVQDLTHIQPSVIVRKVEWNNGNQSRLWRDLIGSGEGKCCNVAATLSKP